MTTDDIDIPESFSIGHTPAPMKILLESAILICNLLPLKCINCIKEFGITDIDSTVQYPPKKLRRAKKKRRF